MPENNLKAVGGTDLTMVKNRVDITPKSSQNNKEKVTSGNKLPANNILILTEDDFRIQDQIHSAYSHWLQPAVQMLQRDCRLSYMREQAQV